MPRAPLVGAGALTQPQPAVPDHQPFRGGYSTAGPAGKEGTAILDRHRKACRLACAVALMQLYLYLYLCTAVPVQLYLYCTSTVLVQLYRTGTGTVLYSYWLLVLTDSVHAYRY